MPRPSMPGQDRNLGPVFDVMCNMTATLPWFVREQVCVPLAVPAWQIGCHAAMPSHLEKGAL